MTDIDQSSPASTSDSATPASALATAQAETERKRPGGFLLAVILLVLLALVLGGALYYQNRQYRALRADLQQQQAQSLQLAQETRAQAGQALSMVQDQATRIKALRDALEATAGQVQEFDQALRLMTDSGAGLVLLNDIDHLVTIAQQQLALGGNVANAIISLEAAQAQLARANRPELAALQQSINGDLERLRAVATIDMPALSARIDRLSDLIGTAPLLVPDTAGRLADPDPSAPAPVDEAPAAEIVAANAQASTEPAARGWRDWVKETWQWMGDSASLGLRELRGLVDVRRVDDTAALLMSPDQALRFREVLKQRAVTAQLALMMRQLRIWQTELEQLSKAIDQRYDMRAESSREALKIARELHDTAIEITLPKVDNSLAAIAAAREAAEATRATEQNGAASDADESDQSEASPAGSSSPAPASAAPVSATPSSAAPASAAQPTGNGSV